MGIFQQLDWLTTRVKRLCCAVEQIQQSGAGSYKVYTALLTQSGGDNPDQEVDGDQTINKGVTYEIINVASGDDLTTIGAPNNTLGTKFVATRDATGEFNGATILYYNTGAPVVTVLENTIGNIWWTYNGIGNYFANSNGLFIENKTVSFISTSGSGILNGVLTGSNWNGVNSVTADTALYFPTPTAVNDELSNTPIEIRVYN